MVRLLPLLLFLLPIEDVELTVCEGVDHPAIVTVYDPALGGINCDGDCTTIATGPFEPWMYKEYAACDISLLGRYIRFPVLDVRVRCMDTGAAVRARWSQRDERCVIFFDVLWPLTEEPTPYWNWWFIEDWR